MNQQGVWSGITETPLTGEGRQQAEAAGKQLLSAGIDCIVASPVTRAYDTAVIIAEQIGFDPNKIIKSDLLTERDFGPLEGTEYTTRINLDDIDGVEHSSELLGRVQKGWQALQTIEADTILVVSHGAVGRALRSIVQHETPFHGSEKFENAEVVKLT